jgi:arginyl-tRNA synthetase
MSAVVDELIQSGIATKNEDESVGIVFDDMEKKEERINNKEGIVGSGTSSTQATKQPSTAKLPSCILQKRDGTHGYLASDLAAIKYRLRNWNPSKIMYFVDNRQALHFKQLFATAEKAWGYKEIELEQQQKKGIIG